MKKIIKYILFGFFTINGAIIMNENTEFSFYWILGLMNVMYFGAYLLDKLIKYLDND